MVLDMSEKELDRLTVLRHVQSGAFTKTRASELLKITTRHIDRLLNKLEMYGPSGLISNKRGITSNRAKNSLTRELIFNLIDTHYYDYGPTLIAEKLIERHGIKIGKETIRQWLIKTGRRKAKATKRKVIHQLRARRPSFGELIQLDGSVHNWFEERGEKYTLLVAIDDATSRLVNLTMVPAETTLGYFAAMHEYLLEYGKPRAIYTDKHVVFKVNVPGGQATNGLTQFGRALKDLGIEAIFAHSPEAKGRVERANNTLQDRLIKDFRYYNISTIDEANAFMKHYIKCHNEKFSVEPQSSIDLHVPLSDREKAMLVRTLSCQKERRINRNLIVKHNNVSYQLTNIGKGHRYKGKKVTIHEKIDGSVELFCDGCHLDYTIYGQAQYKPKFASRKDVDLAMDKIRNNFLMHQRINERGANQQGEVN